MKALDRWRLLSPMERYEVIYTLENEADLASDNDRHATAKVFKTAAAVLRAVVRKGKR